MKKTVHVVPHSHWDREWYFTTSRSKIYLMHDLKKVLDQLEKDNPYESFILDGQASLLDDYLKWRPQDRKKDRSACQARKADYRSVVYSNRSACDFRRKYCPKYVVWDEDL